MVVANVLGDTQAFEKQVNYFLESPGVLFVYCELYFSLNTSKQKKNISN